MSESRLCPFRLSGKKFLSMLLGISLVFQSMPAFSLPAAPAVSLPLEEKSFELSQIHIPPELGSIKEKFEGNSGKMILVVQDAHAIPDAQRSIKSLIEYLGEKYQNRLVVLEGASSRLDPLFFKTFPDQEILKKVFDDYFDKGEVSGGTAAAAFSGGNADYYGVEDWSLYERGLKCFLDSMAIESEAASRREPLLQELEEKKSKIYSPLLLEIDRSLSDFRADKTDFLTVLKKMNAAKPCEKGSELALLVEEAGRPDADASSFDSEIKRIAEIIKRGLESRSSLESRSDLTAFQHHLQDFRTSRINAQTFSLFLKELSIKHHIRVRVSGKLSRRTGRQKNMQDIEGTKLFEEFEKHAWEVKEKLFRSAEEKALDRQGYELELLRRLEKLDLSRDDWNEVKGLLAGGGNLNENSVLSLFKGLKPNLEFYRNSEMRDSVLLKRSVKQMSASKTKTAVLVAGGFHAQGLTERFRSEGISYALIMPEIKKIPEEVLYRDHMLGQVSWRNYFEVENGKVNLYNAFIRGSRDRLLRAAEKAGQQDSLLKEWRDQILRTLASEGRISESRNYTRFIDELSSRPKAADDFADKWKKNVEHFIEGLRGLKSRNQINEQNISSLLQSRPSMIPDGATAPAGLSVLSELRADAIGFLNFGRSELRGLYGRPAKLEVRGIEVEVPERFGGPAADFLSRLYKPTREYGYETPYGFIRPLDGFKAAARKLGLENFKIKILIGDTRYIDTDERSLVISLSQYEVANHGFKPAMDFMLRVVLNTIKTPGAVFIGKKQAAEFVGETDKDLRFGRYRQDESTAYNIPPSRQNAYYVGMSFPTFQAIRDGGGLIKGSEKDSIFIGKAAPTIFLTPDPGLSETYGRAGGNRVAIRLKKQKIDEEYAVKPGWQRRLANEVMANAKTKPESGVEIPVNADYVDEILVFDEGAFEKIKDFFPEIPRKKIFTKEDAVQYLLDHGEMSNEELEAFYLQEENIALSAGMELEGGKALLNRTGISADADYGVFKEELVRRIGVLDFSVSQVRADREKLLELEAQQRQIQESEGMQRIDKGETLRKINGILSRLGYLDDPEKRNKDTALIDELKNLEAELFYFEKQNAFLKEILISSELRSSSARDEIPFEEAPNGMPIFQALNAAQKNEITQRLGLGFPVDQADKVDVKLLSDSGQKYVYLVTAALGTQTARFVIYAPILGILDEIREHGLEELSQASSYVVKFGGRFDISVNDVSQTVVAAEYLEGETLRDVIVDEKLIASLSDEDRENLEKEAVRAYFDVWNKTGGIFIPDISQFATQVTVVPAENGKVSISGKKYDVKIHDTGGARPYTGGQALELFQNMFSGTSIYKRLAWTPKPDGSDYLDALEAGTDVKMWVWNGRDKSGFFDAVLSALDGDKRLPFLMDARTHLKNVEHLRGTWIKEALASLELEIQKRSELRRISDNAVPFNVLVSALRNNIGRRGSRLYLTIRDRIKRKQKPIQAGDPVGNVKSVRTMNSFIKQHFKRPEEAVRELITNAYDAQRNEPDPEKRKVKVTLGENEVRVEDPGSGMDDDVILKTFLPPFASGKRSKFLAPLRKILDGNDSDEKKIDGILARLSLTSPDQLSEIERLSLGDIQRVLALKITAKEKVEMLKNIVIFTGRFGIGFYSLLYFVQEPGDFVEVTTQTKDQSHRIVYFVDDAGVLQIAIEPLEERKPGTGTAVHLKSRLFSKQNAKEVIEESLSFNANAQIEVSEDGGNTREVINSEVFNLDKFDRIENGIGQKVYYSKKKNTNGKSKVLITVHGVTILSKEVEGYGLPEKVVFDFPANIGLPISRNKIEVNDLFLEKAKEMILLIGSHPELLSAFYLFTKMLESYARGGSRGVLSSLALEQARLWRLKVFVPHSEKFSKLKSDSVSLVHPDLAAAANNTYRLIGSELTDSSGEPEKAGEKQIYLVEFSDSSKFVSTHNAILINAKYAPQLDGERALYNVLFALENETEEFRYAPASQEPGSSDQSVVSPRITDPVFEDELAKLSPQKRKFIEFNLSAFIPADSDKTRRILEKIQSFSRIFDFLVSMGYVSEESPAENFPKITTGWTEEEVIDFFKEGSELKRLYDFFLAAGSAQPAIFFRFLNSGEFYEFDFNQMAIQRLWKIRQFISDFFVSVDKLDNYHAVNFLRDSLRLSPSSFEVFVRNLEKHSGDLIQHPDIFRFLSLRGFLDGKFGESSGKYWDARLLLQHILSNEKLAEFHGDGLLFEGVTALVKHFTSYEIENLLEEIPESKKYLSQGMLAGEALLEFCFAVIYKKDAGKVFARHGQLTESQGYFREFMIKILTSRLTLEEKKECIQAVLEFRERNVKIFNDYFASQSDFDCDLQGLAKAKKPMQYLEFHFNMEFVFTHNFHRLVEKKRNPAALDLPFNYDHDYHDEMILKLQVLYQEIKDLQEGEIEKIYRDFSFIKYGVSSTIQPYFNFLVNGKPLPALDKEDLGLGFEPRYRNSLAAIYDTYLELDENAEREEDENPERVNLRLGRAAKALEPERLEKLQEAFQAAAKQSTDEWAYVGNAIQNVIDEVSGLPEDRRVMDINTFEARQGSDRLVVVKFQDKIGISRPKIYNKVSMPFSSDKEDKLGGQGQGFFTLLSNSEYLILKSVKDGKVTTVKYIPLREDGLVIDYDFEEEAERPARADEEDGTTIQVAFKTPYPELEAERISRAVSQTAGLVDPGILKININGSSANIPVSQRYAVVNSRYGEIQFYSVRGAKSTLALGGLAFKELDLGDPLVQLIPHHLRKPLLEHGIGIVLPAKTIKRIQGGSDIADADKVYADIKDAVALGSLKLLLGIISHEDFPQIEDLLGYDYYQQTNVPVDVAADAGSIYDGGADMRAISEKYLGEGQEVLLGRLLMAIQLDFTSKLWGWPASLSSIFAAYSQDTNAIDARRLDRWPLPLQKAFAEIREKKEGKTVRGKRAAELGLDDEFAERKFLRLPDEPDPSMTAYWSFIELTNRVAALAIRALKDEYSEAELGGAFTRIEKLSEVPPAGSYYAGLDKQSAAHARQGGNYYAWNLTNRYSEIESLSQASKDWSLEARFLQDHFEDVLFILTHEIIHLLEKQGQQTHDKNFFELQRKIASALISRKEEVVEILQDILGRQNEIVPLTAFFDYLQKNTASEIRAEAADVNLKNRFATSLVERLRPAEKTDARPLMNLSELRKVANFLNNDFDEFIGVLEKSAAEKIISQDLSQAAGAQTLRVLKWLEARGLPEGEIKLALQAGAGKQQSFLNRLFDTLGQRAQKTEIFSSADSHAQLVKGIQKGGLAALISSKRLDAADWETGLSETLYREEQPDIPAVFFNKSDENLNPSFVESTLDNGTQTDPDVLFHHEVLFSVILILMSEIIKSPDYKTAVTEKTNKLPAGQDPEEIKKIKAEYLKAALAAQLAELGYSPDIFSSQNASFLTLQGAVLDRLLLDMKTSSELRKSA